MTDVILKPVPAFSNAPDVQLRATTFVFATLTAAGIASTSFLTQAKINAVFSAAGVGTGVFVGSEEGETTFNAAGSGSALFITTERSDSTFTITGSGTAKFDSSFKQVSPGDGWPGMRAQAITSLRAAFVGKSQTQSRAVMRSAVRLETTERARMTVIFSTRLGPIQQRALQADEDFLLNS